MIYGVNVGRLGFMIYGENVGRLEFMIFGENVVIFGCMILRKKCSKIRILYMEKM